MSEQEKELKRVLSQFRKYSKAQLVALFVGGKLVAASPSGKQLDFAADFVNFFSYAERLSKNLGNSLKYALLEGENFCVYASRLTQKVSILILFSPEVTSFGSVKLGVMQIKSRIESYNLTPVVEEVQEGLDIDVNASLEDKELDELIEALKTELKENLAKE